MARTREDFREYLLDYFLPRWQQRSQDEDGAFQYIQNADRSRADNPDLRLRVQAPTSGRGLPSTYPWRSCPLASRFSGRGTCTTWGRPSGRAIWKRSNSAGACSDPVRRWFSPP